MVLIPSGLEFRRVGDEPQVRIPAQNWSIVSHISEIAGNLALFLPLSPVASNCWKG